MNVVLFAVENLRKLIPVDWAGQSSKDLKMDLGEDGIVCKAGYV
jgi:hypothetical protein